jgi:hypothetical protein
MYEPIKGSVRRVYEYVLCALVFFGLPVIIGMALATAVETSYDRQGPATAFIIACLVMYLLPVGVSMLARCRAETDGQLFGRRCFLNGRTFLSAVAILAMLGLYWSSDTMDIFFQRFGLELTLLLIASGGLEMVQGEMERPMDRQPKTLSPRLQEQLERLKKLYMRKYLAEYLKRDLRDGRL